MSNLNLISAEMVIEANRQVCADGGNDHQCYGVGKVESSLHTAFWPGAYPYRNGGVAGLAGAVCYLLTMNHCFYDGNKRTALISSVLFMQINGHKIRCPVDPKTGKTYLATLINDCASGSVTKEQMMEWYENHKITC